MLITISPEPRSPSSESALGNGILGRWEFSLTSAVRTARPATRAAHSFFKFGAYALNVLPSGFRFLDGNNPADPFIACEWRNILPFSPRRRVRCEGFSQIRWHTVQPASGDRFLGHGFYSTSLPAGRRPASRTPPQSEPAGSAAAVKNKLLPSEGNGPSGSKGNSFVPLPRMQKRRYYPARAPEVLSRTP